MYDYLYIYTYIYLYTAPSIDALPMAEKLWQHIHEMSIYLYYIDIIHYIYDIYNYLYINILYNIL